MVAMHSGPIPAPACSPVSTAYATCNPPEVIFSIRLIAQVALLFFLRWMAESWAKGQAAATYALLCATRIYQLQQNSLS